MKRLKMLAWTCLALIVMPVATDAATVLTFDDLPVQTYYGTIPNGYGGLQWYEFGIIKPENYPESPGGYLNGMISPRNVAFNAFATSDETTTGSIYVLDSVFDLHSAYLTAAWNDGLQITALGFLRGTLKYSSTYTLDSTSPTLVDFSYSGVDRVNFISSGGIWHGYGSGGGTQVAFDNLVVTVPEPSVPVLFLFGTAFVWMFSRRSELAIPCLDEAGHQTRCSAPGDGVVVDNRRSVAPGR